MELFHKHRTAYRIIIIIAVLGVLAAAYATRVHYSTDSSSLCNLGTKFNCDVVNKGLYAEMFGVPISIFGMLGYIWMMVLAREMVIRPARRIRLMFAASIAFAAGFSMHLAWISSQLLSTWCIVCIASYICTLAILGVFTWSEL
ncbi:MAG: vitamin K epoxide reductase family protein [Candidatus Magasanikbacteria bacterium]|nr:vitamin K epoxide reductase family protein [Candidatus Magasanikbacteria bacterium]